MHSGMLVTVIMLMIPSPFFVLLWQSKLVSYASGDHDHADNSMPIIHSAMAT